MKKSKKRYKGVQYVAKALTKYFPKRYPKYTSALSKARNIVEQIKSKGEKVKLSTIFDKERIKRLEKKGAPTLPEELLRSTIFYELSDYPSFIRGTTNEIHFLSKIIPKGLEPLRGGMFPDYQEYFAPFVNFIDILKAKLQEQIQRKLDSGEYQWYVRCTEPKFNITLKRWESDIISVNATGEKTDFGFDNINPSSFSDDIDLDISKNIISSDKIKSKKLESNQDEKNITTTNENDFKIKQLEAEMFKAKLNKETDVLMNESLKEFMKIAQSMNLSKSEFKEMLNDIRKMYGR